MIQRLQTGHGLLKLVNQRGSFALQPIVPKALFSALTKR
jgi:hypothetical protein